MTPPLFRVTAASAVLCGTLLACQSGPTSTSNPTEGQTEPSDTGFVPGDFIPYAFAIRTFSFGYDPVENQAFPVRVVSEDGSEVLRPIQLDIHLVNQGVVDGAALNETNHCIVTLKRSTPISVAPWLPETGAGFAFQAEGWEHSHNCGALGFSSNWGPYPPKHVVKWAWGAGLGPVSGDAKAIMGDDWPLFEPWVVGSGYYWERLPDLVMGTETTELFDPDGYVDAGIAYAYEIDDEDRLTLATDGSQVLLPASIQPADGPPARAWYEAQVGRYLVPAARLLEPVNPTDTGL